MNKKYHAVLFTGCPSVHMKPLGAHKVAHELRTAGYDVLVINHVEKFSLEELFWMIDQTVSDKTLFVGISSTFLGYVQDDSQPWSAFVDKPEIVILPQGPEADQKFVSHIKSRNQNCKIVFGGTRDRVSHNSKLVDYAIKGFADVSAVQLIKFLDRGEPITVSHYKNLFGVTVIDDNLAETFDFNNSTMNWCDDDIVVPREILPLEISRGCIFSCKFCTYRLNGKQSVDYIKHLDIIEHELLENYKKYGIRNYRLVDDTFNDSEEKIDAMLEITKRLPFQPQYSSYMRLDLIAAKPHTLQKLYDTGFRHMYFGIETLNRATGAIVGKGADPDRQIEMLKHIKATYGDNMLITGSFVCGLPRESKESILNTMSRILSKEIPMDLCFWYPMLIWKQDLVLWDSAINKDRHSFGYEDLPEPPGHSTYLHNWKNEHLSFYEAKEIVSNFYKTWRNSTAPLMKEFFPVTPIHVYAYKKALTNYILNN